MRLGPALAASLLVMPSALSALEPPGQALRLDRSRDGLPVVAVELGGESFSAVLDTGTTRSMIAAAAAERLALAPSARFEIVTATGPVRHAQCAGPLGVRIGGVTLAIDCLGWVAAEARLAGAPDVDLLLGADALASAALWLDLERGRARIAPAGALTDWVRGERLALERIERRPAVVAALPGLGGAPLRLVLDSGADAPLLFGGSAQRVGLTARGERRRAQLATAAGRATREALALGRLRLGSSRVEAGWGLLLPEVADRREDGLLPLAALGPVLLDLSSNLLVLDARLRSRPEGSLASGAGTLASLDLAE